MSFGNMMGTGVPSNYCLQGNVRPCFIFAPCALIVGGQI